MAIGADRVRVLKTEAAVTGGSALDSAPFPLAPEEINPQEDAIEACGVYFQEASLADEQVAIFRDASTLYFSDASTGFSPQPFSSSEANPHLVRFLFDGDGPAEGYVSGAYKESTPTGILPTAIVWWSSPAKTAKIIQKTITRSGILPVMVKWELYDKPTGTLVVTTVTDTIIYIGVAESTRTRTIT